MLNCREATRLMSAAQDRQLKLLERMNLKAHLLLCSGCRHFGEHMHAMRTFARAYVQKNTPPDEPPHQDRPPE